MVTKGNGAFRWGCVEVIVIISGRECPSIGANRKYVSAANKRNFWQTGGYYSSIVHFAFLALIKNSVSVIIIIIIIDIITIAWGIRLCNVLHITLIHVVKKDGQSNGRFLTCSENEGIALCRNKHRLVRCSTFFLR